jgi:hypothetical protein
MVRVDTLSESAAERIRGFAGPGPTMACRMTSSRCAAFSQIGAPELTIQSLIQIFER